MHITIIHNCVLPVVNYGGTERVIWYLAKELVKLGHKVTFLVAEGSVSDFAAIKVFNPKLPLNDQIPPDTDVIHLQSDYHEKIQKPYILTVHGNSNNTNLLDVNSVFVSKNHAQRYGSESFVHNGIEWEDYGKVKLDNERSYFHFLGDAAWRVKNVKGAINLILKSQNEKLAVLGGYRLNFRMGFRFTPSPRIKFHGMVGGKHKINLLQKSKGLIFPVLWHEPFGLAIIESLYFGCPVFGTPYGSLPEIVNSEVGFLTSNENELLESVLNVDAYSRLRCHEYARDCFNSKVMALSYIKKYETVINGGTLNSTPPQLQEIQKVKFLPWNE